MTRQPSLIIPCENLDESIDEYLRQGYRIDMILPSDSPSEVLLSKQGGNLKLWSRNRQSSSNVDWTNGRAGMMYRDLIPGRLGGLVIASHIRILNGGEVADYVHYHKIRFQIIYCLKGLIKVVYEDQGDPFWLHPGDCVLQPPQIRHRVLEASAGAEVIEIGMPAVHETWIEHEITLPTAHIKAGRDFGGQRFVRHVAADSKWKTSNFEGFEIRETGISAATDGLADVAVIRSIKVRNLPADYTNKREFGFFFLLTGKVKVQLDGCSEQKLTAGDSFVLPRNKVFKLQCSPAAELLQVAI